MCFLTVLGRVWVLFLSQYILNPDPKGPLGKVYLEYINFLPQKSIMSIIFLWTVFKSRHKDKFKCKWGVEFSCAWNGKNFTAAGYIPLLEVEYSSVHFWCAEGTWCSQKGDLPEGFSVTQPLSEGNTFWWRLFLFLPYFYVKFLPSSENGWR